MIMRPPQQGTWRATLGCSAVRIGGVCAPLPALPAAPGRQSAPWPRAMLALQTALASKPVVADAMEPFGQDVEQEAPDELVGASVIVRYRARPSRR